MEQFNQLREQYLVSLRKKKDLERILPTRVRLFASDDLTLFEATLSSIKQGNLLPHVAKLKQYSHLQKPAHSLVPYFNNFYNILVSVDSLSPKELDGDVETLYNDVATILINILAYHRLPLPTENYLSLAKNLLHQKRQFSTMWLLTQVLLQGDVKAFTELLRYKIVQFVGTRIDKTFENQADIHIFTSFCCSLLTLSPYCPFLGYKQLLGTLEMLLACEDQEVDSLVLDAMVTHSRDFAVHDYEIFNTKLFHKCKNYCLTKKSFMVSKYLQIGINFVKSEAELLLDADQASKEKMVTRQYSRVKENMFLKNAEYCLPIRSQGVKLQLVELATVLIGSYHTLIDLESQRLYLQLAEEIKSVEKMGDKNAGAYLRFLKCLTVAYVPKIKMSEKDIELLNSFMKESCLFEVIPEMLQRNQKEIRLQVLEILTYLVDLEKAAKFIRPRIAQAGILALLHSLQLSTHLDQLENTAVNYISMKCSA